MNDSFAIDILSNLKYQMAFTSSSIVEVLRNTIYVAEMILCMTEMVKNFLIAGEFFILTKT